MLKKLFTTLRVANQVLSNATSLNPANEIILRSLFLRDLARIGVEDNFYPVNSAANHGLLYLILRTLTSFNIESVLELGAGQSSLLLNAVNRVQGGKIDIVTVEHDQDWATNIAGRVSHQVAHTALHPAQVDGRQIEFYAENHPLPSRPINLLIIDGPPAGHLAGSYNRLGSARYIPTALAEDFVVIIDDAERKGEAALATALAARLRQAGRAVHHSEVLGMKRQIVFSGGGFRAAQYFLPPHRGPAARFGLIVIKHCIAPRRY